MLVADALLDLVAVVDAVSLDLVVDAYGDLATSVKGLSAQGVSFLGQAALARRCPTTRPVSLSAVMTTLSLATFQAAFGSAQTGGLKVEQDSSHLHQCVCLLESLHGKLE